MDQFARTPGVAPSTPASGGSPATSQAPATSSALAAEQSLVMRKVIWKLLPFLTLCYFVAYLDRSNLGLAALTMMPALGLNSAQFGFAAGIFFIGYFLSELPSSLLQVRFGPRKWIARIMISWGLLAMAMALVTGANSLYALRVLLGVAEAGFLPGVIYYLAFWFPAAYRARIFAWFLAAIPVAMMIGAPVSAALLYLDGLAGLQGWQWLFLIEGLPAVLLGVACLWVVIDTPAEARWLSPRETAVLQGLLAEDDLADADGSHGSLRKALGNRKMWLMTLISIGLSSGSYGVVFFLPQIVDGFGGSHILTGFLTAIPFLVSLVAMIAWSSHSDRSGERVLHIVIPLLMSAMGFLGSAFIEEPAVKLSLLSLAAAGTYMSLGPFWQFVPIYLGRGKSAAAGVAIVNMVGSLAGFFGPSLMGYVKQTTGSYMIGLLTTAAVVFCGALLAFTLKEKAAVGSR